MNNQPNKIYPTRYIEGKCDWFVKYQWKSESRMDAWYTEREAIMRYEELQEDDDVSYLTLQHDFIIIQEQYFPERDHWEKRRRAEEKRKREKEERLEAWQKHLADYEQSYSEKQKKIWEWRRANWTKYMDYDYSDDEPTLHTNLLQ